jgi:hypothetical protein
MVINIAIAVQIMPAEVEGAAVKIGIPRNQPCAVKRRIVGCARGPAVDFQFEVVGEPRCQRYLAGCVIEGERFVWLQVLPCERAVLLPLELCNAVSIYNEPE